jgi:hypothetical protein
MEGPEIELYFFEVQHSVGLLLSPHPCSPLDGGGGQVDLGMIKTNPICRLVK